jgi:hypothetical protein
MGVGRARVPGVPVDFRVPRGWPTPNDRWVRENAMWVPPPGWTPLPGLRPAPAGWRFWRPNRLWPIVARTHLKRSRTWWAVADGLLLLTFACGVLTARVHGAGLTIVVTQALAVATVVVMIAAARIRWQAQRLAQVVFASLAAAGRQRRLDDARQAAAFGEKSIDDVAMAHDAAAFSEGPHTAFAPERRAFIARTALIVFAVLVFGVVILSAVTR